MAVSVDPEVLREEAKKWRTLADEMEKIHDAVDRQLLLAPSAFFIGNLSEIVHYPAYRSFWDRMRTRVSGGQVEFELINLVLNRLADEYEETDEISGNRLDRLFSVTDEDVAGITEPEEQEPSEPGGGHGGWRIV